jgi:starch phosphorylase
VGQTIQATARIRLGDLKPEELRVELYHGPISSQGEIEEAKAVEMEPAGKSGPQGVVEYRGELSCSSAGRQGYTVRLLPKHPALVHPYLQGFVTWA